MSRTEEQIRADMAPFQRELDDLRDKERKAESRKVLWKYFKYHNSYGGDRDKWWLYMKVTGVGDYRPKSFEFQTDCDGKIEIRTQERSFNRLDGYIEITAKEFNAAWRAVQRRVANLKY